MMKNIKLLTLFAATLVGSTVRAEADVSVIPGASYWTTGRANNFYEWLIHGGSADASSVSFYTHEGDLIQSMPVRLIWDVPNRLNKMLDSETLNPQPVKYIPTRHYDIKLGHCTLIELLDKHGNTISFEDAELCPCGCKHISPDIDSLRKKFDISKIRKQLFQ